MSTSSTASALAAAARRVEVTIGAHGDDGSMVGTRLDLAVARAAEQSRTQAATLIANGAVAVNDGRQRASYRLEAGDRLTVDIPAPRVRELAAEAIPLDIIYEDDALMVINKAAGMVVHPAPGNWSGTLVNALLGLQQDRAGRGTRDAVASEIDADAAQERAGLVHRLDKETSGLLVVARTEQAHRALSAALAARRIVRRYVALSWGHLSTDRVTVQKAIARDPKDRTRMAIVAEGKQARTDFVRLARFDAADLLRAHLHTGRTHQSRVHLASLGHPVVGDDTYGGGGGRRLAGLPPERHFLHAAWLRLHHPMSGALLEFRAPLPEALRSSLAVVSGMPELAAHTDPLDAFGFFHVDGGTDASANASAE
jgi:23S rRNA pseudouridine1911/1915/1917 synthase